MLLLSEGAESLFSKQFPQTVLDRVPTKVSPPLGPPPPRGEGELEAHLVCFRFPNSERPYSPVGKPPPRHGGTDIIGASPPSVIFFE